MIAKDASNRNFSSRPRRTLVGRLAVLAAVVAAVALISACGGSSSNKSSSGGGSTGSSGSSSSATVKSASISGYGTALVTSSGKSLYLLSSDPSGGSSCSGACAKVWKPLTASGSPTAGGGASSSMLSTFKRKDGTTQVLYDKHALYTFSSPGATSGQGVKSYGGTWYLVAPSGKAITKTQGGGY